MTVERHEFRNRKTTSTVSTAPSISASSTLRDRVLDARAGVAHDAQRHARPAASSGSPRPLLAHRVGDRGGAEALRLDDVDADRLARRCRRRPSAALRRRPSTSATSPSRMTRPLRLARRRAARSPPASRSRPRSRIVRSSSSPVSRPTGAARFCACSACTTCPTLDARRLQRLRPQLDRQLALDAADDVRPRRRRACRAAAA